MEITVLGPFLVSTNLQTHYQQLFKKYCSGKGNIKLGLIIMFLENNILLDFPIYEAV